MFRYVMLVTVLTLCTTTAMAENINHRLGLTGKLGFMVPLTNSQDSHINNTAFELSSNAAFTGGGGIIYGLGKYFALEADITYVPSLDVVTGSTKVAEGEFFDWGLGVQYRMLPDSRLVPYVGVGADFIKGNIEDTTLDWTFGGHVNAGLDYFITKGVALNVDCRALLAQKSDIIMNGKSVGKFDPMNVTATFGARFFLPQKWW